MNGSACLEKVGVVDLLTEISSKPGWLLELVIDFFFLSKTFLLKQKDENEIGRGQMLLLVCAF